MGGAFACDLAIQAIEIGVHGALAAHTVDLIVDSQALETGAMISPNDLRSEPEDGAELRAPQRYQPGPPGGLTECEKVDMETEVLDFIAEDAFAGTLDAGIFDMFAQETVVGFGDEFGSHHDLEFEL